MNKRIEIPNTDLSVCPIGLGTVNAGLAWSGTDADRIFDTYLDYGGNLIDTARVYASGRSEQVVGDWLRRSGKRGKAIIVTKGGHPKFDSPDDDLHIPRMTDADMRSDIEISLRALGIDCIDIYFYHRDNRNQSVESEIETMERFVKEGKIRYYACSNWDADRIILADAYCREKGYRGFIADQALMNLGTKYMNPLQDDTLVYIKGDLYKYHLENPQNLVMPYMGVASGFFHGYINRGIEAVRSSPYCTERNIEVAERCKQLMEKYSASVSQVVLGFFTQQEFACAPLYGPKNAAQVVEALGTLDIDFVKSDYDI